MTPEYVKKHISPEMMEQMRKEYPNKTDDEIIETMTQVFNQVGSIVIKLVSQVWDVLKEATKNMTAEDFKKYMMKTSKERDQTLDANRYADEVLSEVNKKERNIYGGLE